MTQIHFLNGKFVPEEQLLISPRDVGFSRGYAVFDSLRTYNHRPFKLREHVDRFFHSIAMIGLQVPWSKEQVQNWVCETLQRNEPSEDKVIKIYASGGISNTMLPSGEPTIVILVDPLVKFPKERYEKGIGVITVKHERPLSAAKTNNYIEGMKQTQCAQGLGADEPVYYSETQVFEGSNSNVFAVINGELLTPKTNVLAGITRAVLLEILKLDLPVKTKDFTLNDLLHADEAFLSGSVKEITPITAIDGKPLGNGQVGPVTKEVMAQFRNYTLSNLW